MKIIIRKFKDENKKKASGKVIAVSAAVIAALVMSYSAVQSPVAVNGRFTVSDSSLKALSEGMISVSAEPLTVDDEIDILLDAEEIDSGVSAKYNGKLDIPANVRLDKINFDSDFHNPLDSGRITSRFDYRVNPVTGRYVFHTGMDLGAPSGANIYSMREGRVIRATYDSGYGNFVVIEHPNGIRTLYAHCSKLLVQAGDTVKSGQKIALVGSTGNSTGPHLHLEFRKDNQRYDPEWVIGGIYS